MERSEICSLVAIDLSVAFDTVDHTVLLSVLEKFYGITDTALRWYRSYLADRRFKVSIENEFSEVKTFNYSVPQGSCCGPNLFCMYSSTLPSVIINGINLSAFADDHTLYWRI